MLHSQERQSCLETLMERLHHRVTLPGAGSSQNPCAAAAAGLAITCENHCPEPPWQAVLGCPEQNSQQQAYCTPRSAHVRPCKYRSSAHGFLGNLHQVTILLCILLSLSVKEVELKMCRF